MTGRLTFEPVVPWPLVAAVVAVGLPLLLLAAVRRHRGARGLWLVRSGALLAAAALALGPHLGTAPTTYLDRPDVQVVVALDRTSSMAVRDDPSEPSRLDRAARDVLHVARAGDGHVAVVTWGQRARVRLPFTTDRRALARSLRVVRTELPVAGVGSSVTRPRDVLRRVLRDAVSEHPDRATYLLLVTDGEDTDPGDRGSYRSVGRLLAGGLVVGYGSPTGGPVPLDPERPDGAVATDPETGGPAISRLDEQNLRRVAGQLDVGYLAGDDPGAVEAIIEALEPPPVEVAASHPESVAWLVALLLLGLLLPDLRRTCLGARELRDLAGAR